MAGNQLTLLIFFLFSFMIISIVVILISVFKELKEKTSELFIISLLMGVIISIITPMMLGMIQNF